MSCIDELIAKFCPNGVEFNTLGEVLRIKNGKDHKALGDGEIPVYGSGGIMRYADTATAEGPSVLIPRKGSLGNLFYVEGPFWVVDTIFRTEINLSLIEPKFLYHQLLTMGLGGMNQAGGVPSQTQSVLNLLRIPVPPLDVQREIVRVLDQFTRLEAELEAELETRHRQYEYYRENLLVTDAVKSRRIKLGELFDLRAGKFIAGSEIVSEPDDVYSIPCFGGGGLRGYVTEPNQQGDLVLIGRQGALCGNVKRASGLFYATEHSVVVTPQDGVDIRWAFHLLTSMNLNQYASKSAQPGLAVGTLNQLVVDVPSLDEQLRVGSILDKFEALVNDIRVGLPAELQARRQQYEYYRDRLLTFEEATA